MGGYQILSPQVGWFETLRTLPFGSIVAGYTAVGTAIEHPTRVFIVNNLTDIDLRISFDGVNDHIVIPYGGHWVQDTASNGISLPKGTIFYVKRYTAGTAPSSGDFCVSVGYHGLN